jgi:hypothetical protein
MDMSNIKLRQSRLSEVATRYFGKSRPLIKSAIISSALHLGWQDHKRTSPKSGVTVKFFRPLKRLNLTISLMRLISEIDDVIDAMPPEEKLALGEAKLGNKKSPFLKSNEALFRNYFKAISKLNQTGVISKEESISFSNIYAQLIAQAAKAEISYRDSRNPSDRELITSSNLDVCRCLAAHLLQHITPHEHVCKLAQEGTLSLADLATTFPGTFKLAQLIEMSDDLEDMATDLHNEIQSRIVSPNTFITELSKIDGLYDKHGKIRGELKDFAETHSRSTQNTPFEKAPPIVHRAIKRKEEEAASLLLELPPYQRSVISSLWNNILTSGMRPMSVIEKTRPLHPTTQQNRHR